MPPRVVTLVRGRDWWSSKIPPILAVATLQILARRLAPADALPRLAALLVSAVALAAWAHVVNDLFDLEADRRAGKPRLLGALTPAARGGVVLSLAATGLAPWLLTGLDRWSTLVLCAILLVPIAYSAPPLRLKERGILGPIADAGYAHAIPALFVGTLFAAVPGAAPATAVTVLSVAWSFLFGLRGILLHQVWDLPNDQRAGVQTFVGQVGRETVRRAARRVLFPMEAIALLALAVALAPSTRAVLASLVLYALYDLVKLLAWEKRLEPIPDGPGSYVPLYDYAAVWLPLVLAGVATARDPRYGLLLLATAAFAREVLRCVSDMLSVASTLATRLRRALG